MASAVFADPITTGGAVLYFRGDSLENGFHMRPSIYRTAGHDAGSMACAFLAATDSRADEKHALAFNKLDASVCVFEKGIAAINDNVTGFKVGQKLLDELIHGFARFDQHHHATRLLEQGDHLLDGVRAEHSCALGFF